MAQLQKLFIEFYYYMLLPTTASSPDRYIEFSSFFVRFVLFIHFTIHL